MNTTSEPTPWRLVAAAAEAAAILGRSDQFTDVLTTILRQFGDAIQRQLEPDDIALLATAALAQIDGKPAPTACVFLPDRVLLHWSVGTFRLRPRSVELRYDSMSRVDAVGTDELRVGGAVPISLRGFDKTPPIMRDVVAGLLQREFEYRVAASGFLESLTFTKLGMTINYDS